MPLLGETVSQKISLLPLLLPSFDLLPLKGHGQSHPTLAVKDIERHQFPGGELRRDLNTDGPEVQNGKFHTLCPG